MIKHCRFEFEEFKSDNHWVDFAAFGAVRQFEEKYYDDYHEFVGSMNPEKVYQIGLDQSTSNTGLFVKDYNNTEVHMIEVMRARGQDASDYIYDLEMFLHQLFEGCVVSHIIYERPIKTESYRSSQVLFQLEGTVNALSKRYTEFRNAKIDNIENASWRSVVIDKELENVYSRKELSRISINHIFPWTAQYGMSLYKDNDIFEAIGVIMGWFILSFDPMGRPYCRGDRTTRTVGGYLMPGLPGERVIGLLKDQGIEADLKIENPRYSIYENIAAAPKPFKTVCVELHTKYSMLCMCVECNVKWMDPDVCTLILVDAATVDAKLNDIAGGTFHFVL